MKAILFFALISLPSLSEPDCQHDAKTFRCVKVLKNYDGDTITVDIPGVHPLVGENISVRVIGIDTPEMKGKGSCEKEAAQVAKELVGSMLKSAKRVDLINVQRDKYFRILATVEADGRSIADALIKQKLAYAYDGGKKLQPNWCQSVRIPASHLQK